MHSFRCRANVIVAGSAVFGGNVEENVKNFKEQFQNFEDYN